jgi:DNA-binding MurR/RpiR family transcriptional regulator
VATRKLNAIRASEPVESGDVVQELRRRYDHMTQSQKRIAEYIVDNAESVAFSTVDQLAGKLDVNPSTIVRFTYRLGLNGFPDLQERMRKLVRGQLSRADTAATDGGFGHLKGTSFGASLQHDMQNLHRTISGLSVDDLSQAVKTLVKARRVYIAAGFSTYPAAYYTSLILDRLRSDVVLISADAGLPGARLEDLDKQDCLLAFTFPRYSVATQRLAQWAKENQAKVIAVTDTPISAVGQLADIVLVALAAGSGMQNSLVAPIAVANALLNGVAAERGTAGLERYSRHDKLLNRWDAFLLKLDETK